jgi:transcriptional regulator with XRE-family HTH domain
MKRKELFSDFLRKKRLEKGLGLREFARLVKMQPSNYCNVESGSLPPPADKLNIITASLDLQKGSPEYRKFIDLASKVRNEIPSDIKELIRTNSLIPAMLRTIEDHDVKPEQLKRIIKDIRSGHYGQKA